MERYVIYYYTQTRFSSRGHAGRRFPNNYVLLRTHLHLVTKCPVSVFCGVTNLGTELVAK